MNVFRIQRISKALGQRTLLYAQASGGQLPYHGSFSLPFKKFSTESNSMHNEQSSSNPKPPRRSLFSRLLGYTILSSVGIGIALYFEDVRNLVRENLSEYPYVVDFLSLYEQSLKYLEEDVVPELKQVRRPNITGSPSLPLPSVEDFALHKNVLSEPRAPPKTIVSPEYKPTKKTSQPAVTPMPSYEKVETMMKERTEKILESDHVLMEDINKLKTLAGSYVETALNETKELNRIGKEYSSQIIIASKLGKKDSKWNEVAKLSDKFEAIKNKASKSYVDAKHQLMVLHNAIEKARMHSKGSQELMKAMELHRDLQYRVDLAIVDSIKLEVEVGEAMRHKTKLDEQLQKLKLDIKNVDAEKTTFRGKKEMSKGELNLMLMNAYSVMDRMENQLDLDSELYLSKISEDIRHHATTNERIMRERVNAELARAANNFCIERISWERETDDLIDRELEMAIARHSDHLTQMLKLQQEQLEHKFQQRLSEALVAERQNFTRSIRHWTKRMEAIEHVIEGRTQLDKIAKQAQAFWIAVEALATQLEFPVTGRLGKSMNEIVPKTTGPLKAMLESIKKCSPESKFVEDLLVAVPKTAEKEGVWTASALKERFDDVYKHCRRVVNMNDLDTSLWQYLRSWLQSTLTINRARPSLWNRFTGNSSNILIKQETELDENLLDLDQFRILDSAREAVQAGDLELALKLLHQLRGQARLLALDWIRVATVHLETWLISQALLANASATGMNAFQERL